MTDSRIKLGVNIDHVATVRQARGTPYPNIVEAAAAAEAGGADSITVHLREDRRHIQDQDVFKLQAAISTHINLELAATAEMTAIACQLHPVACCVVPERREELTTEGGLDVINTQQQLGPICQQLAGAGIEVSLFIDPSIAQIDCAAALGVPTIELHTGRYADALDSAAVEQQRQAIAHAAQHAEELGLTVNAGHGLHLLNVAPIAQLPQINELNIGHSIVARALFCGLEVAVREMRTRLDAVRQ